MLHFGGRSGIGNTSGRHPENYEFKSRRLHQFLDGWHSGYCVWFTPRYRVGSSPTPFTIFLFGALAHIGRASVPQSEGGGFESLVLHQNFHWYYSSHDVCHNASTPIMAHYPTYNALQLVRMAGFTILTILLSIFI